MEENTGKPENGKIRKVAIIGPESTGKSKLSEQLAAYYNTVYVPEFARSYIENLNRPYQKSDLLEIAKGQLLFEDEQIKRASKYLICDTNLWVIKIWSDHTYGSCDDWILENIRKRKYDLHLLTYIDVPWEPDPQREHPTLRSYFFNVYKNTLAYTDIPYAIIKGNDEERLKNAISAIEALL